MASQNSSHNIAAGDVVQLRSGGPYMTVQEIHRKKETARCIWMDGSGRLREHSFPAVVLTANLQDSVRQPEVPHLNDDATPVYMG